MAPSLDDLTVRQDHNLRGTLHDGQVMGDDDDRLPLHQVFERFHDDGRRRGIQSGERLVQDNDRGVAHDRSSDGDALALPAREGLPSLSDHRVVAFR